jgi:RNA polymerase sigma factor (sigma-70 family)
MDTTWNSRSTIELVREARKQRPEAWAALYRRCSEDLGNFCRHFLAPGDELRRFCETGDILHEAFLLAMEHIDRLENDASFYAWIRTIVRRRISLRRRDALRDRSDLDADDRAKLDNFEEELALADEAVRVLDVILELFPEHAEAMAVFCYVQFEEDCTPEKLVERLGLSRRTVYRRLTEATELLRARLES